MSNVWMAVVLCSWLVFVSSTYTPCKAGDQEPGSEVVRPVIDRTLCKDGQRLLISGPGVIGMRSPEQLLVFPIRDDAGLWGYMTVDGKIVLPPQFEGVGAKFSEGLLAVKCNGRWGYLNDRGEMVIPPQFQEARSFSNGRAVVSNSPEPYNKKYGAIDATGKLIIPQQYYPFYDFRHGVAWVAESIMDGVGVINTKGDIVLPYGKFGNTSGTHHWWFKDGISFVKSGKYDPMGRNGIPTSAFVATTGKKILTVNQMDQATYFDHGVCFVRVGGKWGLINAKGTWLIKPTYTCCFAFGVDYYSIPRYTDTAVLFYQRPNLNVVDQTPAVYTFAEGLAPVERHGKFGFINTQGTEVIKLQYLAARHFSDGLAAVNIRGKYGFINKQNQLVISPKYDEASYFREGLAPAKTKGKYGCIDTHGTFVIKPQYNYIDIFRDGLAVFYQKDRWGYINHAGKEVWSGKIIERQ